MKKQLYTLMITMICCGLSSLAAGQGITQPRVPSPAASVSQTIGITTITVTYSRPSVKGRAIWGELVPYGWNVQSFGNQKSAPWRAGANENTTIAFSHPVKMQGIDVPAGTYGLFFTINADNSGEVILSKDYRSWGSFFYEADHDQLRQTIHVRDHDMTERLTYDFINLEKNSVELVLDWEKKEFPVKIDVATDDIVMQNAAEELKNTTGFNWQGYASAANYAALNNTHLEEGLVYANRAVNMNKNFNTLIARSGLEKRLGKTMDAEKTEAEALALGTEVEINAYGYQLLNQNMFDDAIRIFKANTDRFPNSANCWDSLGEAYAIKGDKENAIINFKKALTLDPPEGTKANSMKYLKQLGAM